MAIGSAAGLGAIDTIYASRRRIAPIYLAAAAEAVLVTAWTARSPDAMSDSIPIDGARIACVDLNGVLDAYTGWKGAEHFDPPRPGAREFLTALHARGFRIVIFTTRWADDVWQWLRDNALADLVTEVTDRKLAAHVFVDDRAVCFRGDFEATLREIDGFAAHWE